ncbi:MAG: serine hydrolase, partial [Myxococcota bacterium]
RSRPMAGTSRFVAAAVGLALLGGGRVSADEVPGAGDIDVPARGQQVEWDVIEDRILKGMRAIDEIAPFEDKAPLWDHHDAALQRRLTRRLESLGLADDVRRKHLSVVLVDITDPDDPRVASVNGDEMMYAASLPKIAVLLAAFEKIAQGKMKLDFETEWKLHKMIKASSNAAATEMMHAVGKEYIARVLLSPRYKLYDPMHNGGLWVGKDYAKSGLWRRDPLHKLSHGATAMQVARYYYLLETENLVTPEHSRKMKEILGKSLLHHKFVKAIDRIHPDAEVSRKSGSWRTYHSDSAIVEHDGRKYIAVALSNDEDGALWLDQIITALDGIIHDTHS